MLDATFMQRLSMAYLNDDDVLARIFDAATQGNVGVSFELAALTADIITALRDAGYTVEPDSFHNGNVYVRWY